MSNSKVVWAFVGGALAGAALGLLFAPGKGSDLRKDLTDKAKDLAGKIMDKANELADEYKAKTSEE